MTWDRGPRIVLLVAVVAGLAVGAWAIIVWLPARLVADAGLSGKDLLDAENDARGSLISAVGGLVLLGGLVFTARSYLATREGKVTDRYTAAVNQLGDSHLVVRLGGIYALGASPAIPSATVEPSSISSPRWCARQLVRPASWGRRRM